MTRDALLAEILRLPPVERMALLESVWDRTTASPEEVPVPAWHVAELDHRLADSAERADLSWDEVRARLEHPPK